MTKPYRQILLVSENKEESVTEFIFVQHTLQLFAGLDDTVTVVAVNNEDDTLSVLEVVSPEGTDLVLATDIPHGELNVLVLDGLDVETYKRDVSPTCSIPETVFHAQNIPTTETTLKYTLVVEGEGLTNCGDGGDDFTQLQLIQDGGLSGGVETDHQDSHLLTTP